MRFQIGDHVKVKGELGVIKYIGDTEFAPGTWFGVELERPIGKNDGSVKGVRYFHCRNSGLYGVFVKEERLEVSDSRSITLRGDSVEHLQGQLRATLHANALCEKELKVLENRLEDQMHLHQQLESKLEMQSIDNQYLQEAKDTLETKVAELTKNYQSLQKDYAVVLEELEIGKEIENELQFVDAEEFSPGEIKLLIERGRLNEKIKEELNTKVRAQDTQLSEMSNQLQTYNTKLHDLSTDLSNKISEVSALKEKLESLSDLEQMTEQLTMENGELLSKIESLEQSLEELNELHTLDAKIEASLQKNEQSLKHEIEHLRGVISKDKDKIKQLESQLSSPMKQPIPDMKENNFQSTSEHAADLKRMELKLSKTEQKYRQCALELQVCESKSKIYAERVKFHFPTSVDVNYIDLIYDMKAQSEILDNLYAYPGHDETFVFYKYAVARIRHFCQTVVVILEYNYAHDCSRYLFNHSQAYSNQVHVLIEELKSFLVDHDAADSQFLEAVHDHLKQGLDLCHEYVSKLHRDNTEVSYLREHGSLIKHIEFILTKFLSYLNGLASLRGVDGSLSLLIESIKSIKSSYDKLIQHALSDHHLDNVSIKYPSPSIAHLMSSTTEVSFELIGSKTIDSKRVDELHKAWEKCTELEVSTDQSIADAETESIYDYVKTSLVAEETDSTGSRTDNLDAKEALLSKDKEISDLKLNISLLEQNMKLFTKKTLDQIQRLENSVSSISAESEDKSSQISKLQEENQSLRNQSQFYGVNLDDIESQRAFDEKIERIERLIELRERATNSPNDESLSWLPFPKRSKVWQNRTYLQCLSNDIRNLATQTQFICIDSMENQKWTPQNTTPRYINACIDEQFTRYKLKKEKKKKKKALPVA
ncbi:NIP100 [Candida theae]|uniref:NIP100 n=1 Tax=Candida theae TaxID=1198502 RepID=A0AAD5FWH3_9ASCO|nr:NIP100 [Candida theae]KAI5948911.1 NIP100 [Candida theae]